MSDLEEIEAIKRLKYRYFRCVDCKLWAELAQCFSEDAVASFSGGQYSFQGVDAIIGFLKEVLNPMVLSMHNGHNPEIELTGDKIAFGTWALESYLIMIEANLSSHGTSFYHDEYVKIDDEWKIKSTGYDRVFEEMWSRSDIPSLKVTQSMFAPSIGQKQK